MVAGSSPAGPTIFTARGQILNDEDMTKSKGMVAAGHELTAKAGVEVLNEGGNAFDAILASLAASCVCEPILSSFAGGGFLLASPAEGESRIYDFFVKTPQRPEDQGSMDFKDVDVYYGSVTQKFHIGKASAGVPGVVLGLFEIHKDLGFMPMKEILAPAIDYARKGVRTNAYQAFLFQVVRDILATDQTCTRLFTSPHADDLLLQEGDLMILPEMADFMESLAIEGPDLFYRGDIAQTVAGEMEEGGLITRADLEQYDVARREPLSVDYHGAQIEMNAPPSAGGLLIAFGLKLLEQMDIAKCDHNSEAYLQILAQVMDMTQKARLEKETLGCLKSCFLEPDFIETYRAEFAGRPAVSRGTTHISAIDADRNMASMTVSIGEGSGYIIPGTAIQMNNMLGEKDLNPAGFHNWEPGERLCSMMTPTMIKWPDGRQVATGTGGANRIRTAMLQQIVKLVDYNLSIEESVKTPRIHLEDRQLDMEGCFDGSFENLLSRYPNHNVWEGLSMFFGGIHSVGFDARGINGCGDPRRDGFAMSTSV